jgi:hypothetical protein
VKRPTLPRNRVPRGTRRRLTSLFLRIEQLERCNISFRPQHKAALKRMIAFLYYNDIEGAE